MDQTKEQNFEKLLGQAEVLRQLHKEKEERINEPAKRPADTEPTAKRPKVAEIAELFEPEESNSEKRAAVDEPTVDFCVTPIPEEELAKPAEQLEVQLSEATEEPKKKKRSKKSKKAKKAKRAKKSKSKKAPAKRKSRGPRPKTIKVLGQQVPNEVGSASIIGRLNRINQTILSCQKLGNIKGIDYAQTNEIMQEELAHAVRQIHQRVKVNNYKYTDITKLFTVEMPDRLTFERDEVPIEPRTPRPPVQEDFDEIDLHSESPSLINIINPNIPEIPATPQAVPEEEASNLVDVSELSESYHF